MKVMVCGANCVLRAAIALIDMTEYDMQFPFTDCNRGHMRVLTPCMNGQQGHDLCIRCERHVDDQRNHEKLLGQRHSAA